MNNVIKILSLVVVVFVAQGCATGYNHSLVSSQANIGLDLNAQPGKMEAAVSSSTSGMTPTFEGGQTLPILSSISTRSNKMGQIFQGQSSTVLTGDAAYNISYLYADCNKNVSDIPSKPEVKLTQKPKAVPGPGEVKPAIFSSDAMMGLKLTVGRETPISPTAFKLGFNREEAVSTPVSVKNKIGQEMIVGTPSLIASLDHAYDLERKAAIGDSLNETPSTFHQYFAIGEAANNLSLRSDLRREVVRRITPDMQDNFCEDDFETKLR
jgi:hypothetical protein